MESAVKETEAKFDEAKLFLEDVKSRSGNAEGSMWCVSVPQYFDLCRWMQHELEEAQKYLPRKKATA